MKWTDTAAAHRWRVAAMAAGLALCIGDAAAQARGPLLYFNHCMACHGAEVHWRDHRLATDWKSLKAQVRRWQSASSLGWNEEDIDYVTSYLNTRYYDFVPAGAAPGAPRTVVPVEVAPRRATVPAH